MHERRRAATSIAGIVEEGVGVCVCVCEDRCCGCCQGDRPIGRAANPQKRFRFKGVVTTDRAEEIRGGFHDVLHLFSTFNLDIAYCHLPSSCFMFAYL